MDDYLKPNETEADHSQEWEQSSNLPTHFGETQFEQEEEAIELQSINHTHYFIRKGARDVGCRDCFNIWPGLYDLVILDDGKMKSK